MSKVLNDAQRKLVEDNHNLIYSFLNSRHLGLDSTEDWYGAAAIGLCKAALVYDESRGAPFTALAYVCMDNEVRSILRNSRKNASSTVSLDKEVSDADGCYLADILLADRDFYYPVYLNDAFKIARSRLGDRDREIVDLIVNCGMTHTEAAQKMGVPQQTVSRAYRKFLGSIGEYFND